MTQKSNGRGFSLAFLVTMVTLSAAAGAVLTVILGTIAIQVGPWADRKATSARRQCDDAGSAAGYDALREQRDPNSEVRQALLTALARNPGFDDTSTSHPDAPTPPDLPAQHQGDLEMPSPEEIVEQEEAEAASLEGELEQEAVDSVWAPATEQATARAIAATKSMYVDDVTCGESLCRVQVTHRDLAEREQDVEKLLGTIPGGGQARVYALSDEPTTVMYFSREGKQLSIMTPSAPWVPMPPLDAMDSAAAGEGEYQPPPEDWN